jgi:ribose transport system substrate-binding protein
VPWQKSRAKATFALGLGLALGVALLVSVPGLYGATNRESAPAAAQKNVRIGLVLTDLTVSTINDIYLGAKKRAAEVGNVTVLEGGSSKTVDWLNACQRIISSHIDVLAYSTLDDKGTRSCIVQADKMGLPIICVLPCTPIGSHNVRFQIDFHGNGAKIGTWMGKALHGKGETGIIVGAPGDQAAAQLVQGFKDGLKQSCPACKVVAQAPGGFNRQSAYTSALTVMTAHPNIAGIYSLNDDGALGVLRAVKQNGKLGKVLIAGHNGACEALDSILKDSGLGFTVLFAGGPFGFAAVDTAVKLVNGVKVPATISNIKSSIPIDHATALAYLQGKHPNPPGVDVKEMLTKIQQKGC